MGILAEGWGKNYENLLRSYERKSTVNECLYTSQLSGGLIDFKSKIYVGEETFTAGVFEKRQSDILNIIIIQTQTRFSI